MSYNSSQEAHAKEVSDDDVKRLHDAAPDLLEACKEALDKARQFADMSLVVKLEAAIAKAEGRE